MSRATPDVALPPAPRPLPAPGLSVAGDLPFRDSLAFTLRTLRRREAFATLPPASWRLFMVVALFWQGDREAWPSQATLGKLSGYSCRAVRGAIRDLEARSVLRLRRSGGGWERLFYAPGPVTCAELAAVWRPLRRERRADQAPLTGPVHGADTPAMAAAPPAVDAGTSPPLPAMAAADPRQPLPTKDLRIKKIVLVNGDGDAASGSARSVSGEEEEQRDSQIPGEDQELARRALAEYFRRRHPRDAAPRCSDEADVALVAHCAAAVAGDAETKWRALRDAIEGAFRASQRPPTVRFIWGRIEHFLGHVERGRRLRWRAEDDASGRREPHATTAMRRRPASAGAIPREQREADMQRLFGPNWRAR